VKGFYSVPRTEESVNIGNRILAEAQLGPKEEGEMSNKAGRCAPTAPADEDAVEGHPLPSPGDVIERVEAKGNLTFD
jgi:hypothetical protein